jgi:hypothetical protein
MSHHGMRISTEKAVVDRSLLAHPSRHTDESPRCRLVGNWLAVETLARVWHPAHAETARRGGAGGRQRARMAGGGGAQARVRERFTGGE